MYYWCLSLLGDVQCLCLVKRLKQARMSYCQHLICGSLLWPKIITPCDKIQFLPQFVVVWGQAFQCVLFLLVMAKPAILDAKTHTSKMRRLQATGCTPPTLCSVGVEKLLVSFSLKSGCGWLMWLSRVVTRRQLDTSCCSVLISIK